MAVPAERAWELVSDITRIGEFSPETFEAEWLEPRADGSDVTESFELADTLLNRLFWAVAGHARRRTNLDGMRQTLDRIKAAAESDGSAD